jgi:hypothetical protein
MAAPAGNIVPFQIAIRFSELSQKLIVSFGNPLCR